MRKIIFQMVKSTRLMRLIGFVFIFTSQFIFATNKISIANGNWSDVNIWIPVGIPTAADNVAISAGTTVTMDLNGAVCLSLLIDGIAEWKLAKTTFVGIGGVIINGGKLTNAGTLGTLNISGDFRATGDTSFINGVNLKINGSTIIETGAVLKITSTNGAKQINDLIIDGTWDCTVSDSWKIAGNLFFNGADFISGGGTYTFTGINKTISGKPITMQVLNIDNDAFCTNMTSLVVTDKLLGAGTFVQGENSTLNIATTASMFSVTTFLASANGNTVIYDRLGVQKVRKPDDGAYFNLEISGNNIKTTAGTLSVLGNLTIQSKLDVSSINNDSIKLAGNWINNGNFDKRKGTVLLNGTNSQIVFSSSDDSFYNLICAGNGTKKLASTIFVDDSLQINTSSILDVSSANYAITLKGNLINNGILNAQKGTIFLNGTAAEMIGGTSITSFYNIVLNNSAGAYLSNSENLIGTLTLTKGTFTSTGNNFTLLSNANGTASIASIPTGSDFIGNITMQRYLPFGQTGWRFLASAVSGATIQQWANCFATSGFAGSTDPSNPFVSIYKYDETYPGNFSNGYVGATNVSNPILNTGGYWCYVGPTPLTISVSGAPNKFTQTFSPTFTASAGASQDGWNMISNTYPSAIDWNSTGWTKTKINNAIYIWNSQLQQYASYVGVIGTNGGSNIIPSSQSFWVQTNGNSPKLTMKEDVKSANNQPFTKINDVQKNNFSAIHLRISGNSHSDETFILFQQNATTAFDSLYDAYKIFSTSTVVPSISSLSQNSDFSINSLPELSSSLSIPIRVKVGISGNYTITTDNLTNLPMSSCFVLEDLLTGIKTDLKTANSYSFNISDTTNAPRFLLHVSAGIQKNNFSTDCEHSTAIVKTQGTETFTFIWKNNFGTILKTITKTNPSDTLKQLVSGTYYITINDSNSICGSATDTIIIPEKAPVYTNFTINKDTVFVGEKIFFTNTSSGENNFLWNYGDGNSENNFDANHSYDAQGIYVVTLIASNESCTDSIKKTITVLDNPTSVKEINLLKNNVHLLTINNQYFLQFSFSELSNVTIGVINSLGQKLIPEQQLKVQNNSFPINFPSSAKGIYFIKIWKNNQNIVFKVFK